MVSLNGPKLQPCSMSSPEEALALRWDLGCVSSAVLSAPLARVVLLQRHMTRLTKCPLALRQSRQQMHHDKLSSDVRKRQQRRLASDDSWTMQSHSLHGC